MAVKYFPAGIAGTCSLCGEDYARLDIVGFYPAGTLSHVKCILNPPVAKPLFKLSPEKIKALRCKLAERVNEGCVPYDFQLEGLYAALKWQGNILIADEQGLGKTAQALMWLAANRKIRPVVIVAPSSVKLNWKKEIRKWLPRLKSNRVIILNGRSPKKLTKAGIYILNYDIAAYWIRALRAMKPQVVICDESQRLKNPKAKRTKAILGDVLSGNNDKPYLVQDVPHRIFLSGTPLENRPVELWSVLATLRPVNFPDYWRFVKRYCGAQKKRVKFFDKKTEKTVVREIMDVSHATNILELHKLLMRTCVIRRVKTEVDIQLPEKRRATIPLEITNRKEYSFAAEDVIAYLKDKGEDATKAARAETIVQIEKLKQLSVKGKLDAAVEWINDYLSGNEKLVIFVHHKNIGVSLMESLKEFSPVAISGSMTDKQKQAATEKFQKDAKTRVAVCSLRAAGVGITLTAANAVVFLELGWTPGEHAQAEDRIHRIGQRKACTAYYLLADKTIEEDIAELIDSKRKVLTGVLDGRNVDATENILNVLVERMAA